MYPNDSNGECVKGEKKEREHEMLKREDDAQSCFGCGSSISFVRAFFCEILFIALCKNVHSSQHITLLFAI